MNFNKGDGIRYHGNTDNNTPSLKGKIGTVVRQKGEWVHIKWDSGVTDECLAQNLELYAPTEVEQAIALLKRHGTVTFIPTFKPITIKLNGEYNAIVHEDHVKVGCQQFNFDKVLELAETVQKVKAQLKQ